jgi:hypothetical protein
MNAHKLFILLSASFACIQTGMAQKQVISVGNTRALTIRTGTVFSADSLVLIPGSDFTLSSNNIQVSPVAVALPAGPSINRVYYLGSPINFTGNIQLYYRPSELNGNLESTLEYTDSTTSVTWLPELSCTVNTGLHYVQFAATPRTFIGATASGPAIILPLSLLSFTGNWDQENPALKWTVFQTGEVVNFVIEGSSNGAAWINIGQIDGLDLNGTNTYGFNDNTPSGHIMYYRIRLSEPSGQYLYSHVLKLQKNDNNNDIRLVVTGNGVAVRFIGVLPTAIRLVNVAGMVLRSDRTSRQEYDVSGLTPGAYFLQYEMNGQWSVRKFVVY